MNQVSISMSPNIYTYIHMHRYTVVLIKNCFVADVLHRVFQNFFELSIQRTSGWLFSWSKNWIRHYLLRDALW